MELVSDTALPVKLKSATRIGCNTNYTLRRQMGYQYRHWNTNEWNEATAGRRWRTERQSKHRGYGNRQFNLIVEHSRQNEISIK
jgi:hypothetical protein